ncbi:hypothetical protein BC628DRAFT_1317983 [Trametes gibbosa]|nr:hypothetical protein BC628DRAFT_1317983 [Trametes gibbosa]
MAIGTPPLLLLLLAGTAVVGANSGALLGPPGDISQCAIGCIAAAGSPDGCTQLRGVQCMCRDGSVLQAALACVEKRCTSDDMDATLQLFVDSCALLSGEPGPRQPSAPAAPYGVDATHRYMRSDTWTAYCVHKPRCDG